MKTKKILSVLLVLILLLSSCTKTNDKSEEKKEGLSKLENIMFVVTGSLGGGTNNDDVYAVLKAHTDSVGGNIATFECNMDTSVYETTLMQASESKEYDLIVTGFGTMIEPLQNTAAKFPEQKYFIFDTEMDYSQEKNKNIISVQVLQNQGGFMAGVLAAQVTSSDAKLANADKKVGFVGAMESTSILDFLIGYIEGVKYVDPEVEVIYSFVGNHTDAAVAKELAISQYQQGADVVFAVGGNGLGVAQASFDENKYAIGVDFDYAARLKETSPEIAEHILTSVIKDYKGMVSPILEQINENKANWGSHQMISYSDGGVYLVNDENTKAIASEEIIEKLKKAEESLKKGEIKVSTAFGASTEEIDKIKDKAGVK